MTDTHTALKGCPHFPDCGGCRYQDLSYDEQLHLKENEMELLFSPVLEDLGPDGSESWENVFEGIESSPDRHSYRNKMEYSFGDSMKNGPLTLGLHRKRSFYDVLTTDSCNIVDGDFRKILSATLSFFSDRGITYFHRRDHKGILRHLIVRKGRNTGEILCDLVASTQGGYSFEALLSEWKDVLLSLDLEGKFAGILVTWNDSLSDAVVDEGTNLLFGTDSFSDTILGLKFSISPFSFFQTNTRGAEVLYSVVRDMAMECVEAESFAAEAMADGKGEAARSGDDADSTEESSAKPKLIYDLYCGTGTITQLMSPVAERAVGVEIVAEAVEKAVENAERNGIENCSFICSDVGKALDDMPEKPDLIILDPPRDGVAKKALQKVLSYGVKNIIYVSCKPSSLARDLPFIHEEGYVVKRMKAVDMFPFTANCETVALLSKLSEAKHHIEVKVDMDELDLTSAEAKATYKEIQDWVQEKYGFHVTNLNIAQVKQKHGIIERENYNKPKSPDSKQPGCPEEKVKVIEDALRHFQMI